MIISKNLVKIFSPEWKIQNVLHADGRSSYSKDFVDCASIYDQVIKAPTLPFVFILITANGWALGCTMHVSAFTTLKSNRKQLVGLVERNLKSVVAVERGELLLILKKLIMKPKEIFSKKKKKNNRKKIFNIIKNYLLYFLFYFYNYFSNFILNEISWHKVKLFFLIFGTFS